MMTCPHTQRRSFGFTLIELLVSLAIIGVIVGVGIAGFSRFQTRQRAIQAAKDVESNLRFAKTRATSGEKPTGCSRLISYRMQTDAGLQSYALYAVCDLPPSTIVIQRYTLPTGVNFSASVTLDFLNVLGGVGGSSVDVPIYIGSTDDHYCSITVNRAGTITTDYTLSVETP